MAACTWAATKIPIATIAALADGGYLDDHESIILVGDSDTGKTHLATALGIRACSQGRRMRFTKHSRRSPTRCKKPRAAASSAVSSPATPVMSLILEELG